MKVALVSSGLVPIPPIRGGAVEEYVFQLTKHLKRLSVDAVAIDSSYVDSEVIVEDIDGARIIRLPTRPSPISIKKNILQEILFGKAVVKHINKEGYDVIHINTAWVGFTIALYHRLKKLNVHGLVYTCHNPLWPEDKVHFGERVVRVVEAYVMKTANLVVALNKTMHRALVEKAKLNEGDIVIIPNGVDTEFFKPGLRDDQVLDRYGIEEQNYILFVGRVSPEKGVHILLRAFRQVANNIPKNFKLVIVGPLAGAFNSTRPSKYAEAMLKYAKERLGERVVFTGAVDKNSLRILYSNAYCFALPSLAEAFGMVLLEAMASGIPPIGSTAGGIPDIIINGVNGVLFEKGNWRDLADKMLSLVQDKTFRDRLAVNARKHVEEKFSWESIALRFKRVYELLMVNHGNNVVNSVSV